MLTWLYTPADHPGRLTKALAGPSDVVVVDLEDAVAPAAKDAARAAVVTLLTSLRRRDGRTAQMNAGDVPAPRTAAWDGVARDLTRLQVRVNDVRTAWGLADLRALAPLMAGTAGLRLPKTESPALLRTVADTAPGVPLHPLIESAVGLERAYDIATAHPSVASIGLGEADLRAELGVHDEAGLAWARSRVVVAARAAGLPAPAQSVYTDVRDLDGLAASCRLGRAMGFRGRAAIHPAQLPVIVAAYRPTAPEIAAAEAVLTASGAGATVLPDGRFVDEAIIRQARATLADATGGRNL
ncbi:CoA ester lyase [Sphaerisporangium rubeum]|uniref:Citrate lyase subunit beta/citryl-CoA lyase n=1 Tax=Sphaerisporangium rubeum TaxID=321317 RepID=A0A7X0ID73_9ACTN|nr:CoA ester lyase [Sphaerisporangium rubeum]MBB6473099.1 citrate lyase subunit beta/citryl-CoA lyase [Sphaerisporangium rubeum]